MRSIRERGKPQQRCPWLPLSPTLPQKGGGSAPYMRHPAGSIMILFPAIDLKNGQCVRLEQGDMARATVFTLDPAAQAQSFVTQGFEYLHVVDLDGAFAGKPVNASAVEAM